MLQNLAFAISQVTKNVVRTGLLVSSISVFAEDPTLGGSGASSGVYDVPLLVDEPCMDANESDARILATQRRSQPETATEGFRHVWIARDVYPVLQPASEATLQAVISDPDGSVTTYIVLGVERDSQMTQTRLKLEVISV